MVVWWEVNKMMMVMMIAMVGREGSEMRLLVGMIMFKMRTRVVVDRT